MEAIMAQAQATLASHVFSVERRRNTRTDLVIYTHLKLNGSEQLPIEIGNISSGGMMARVGRQIEEGTKLQVELPGMGWYRAQVIWAFGDNHGFAFEAPLDQFYLDMLVRMHSNQGV
jgi:hypothetical protein